MDLILLAVGSTSLLASLESKSGWLALFGLGCMLTVAAETIRTIGQ